MRSRLMAVFFGAFIGACIGNLLPLGEKHTEPAIESPSTPSVVVKQVDLDEVYPHQKFSSAEEFEVKAEKVAKEREKRELVAYKKQIAERAKYLEQQRAKKLAEQRAKRLAEQRAKELATAKKLAEQKAKKAEISRVEQVTENVVSSSPSKSSSQGGGGSSNTLSSKLQGMGISNATYYVSLATTYGNQYGIDPVWLLAMAKTESDFNPYAVSSHEAVGIMQILPSTARALGVSPSSLTNPEVSFSTSAKYLAMLQSQFGSVRMATIAYNQGEGNVRNGSYRTWYYDKVLANYNTLKR